MPATKRSHLKSGRKLINCKRQMTSDDGDEFHYEITIFMTLLVTLIFSVVALAGVLSRDEGGLDDMEVIVKTLKDCNT